MTGVDRDLKQDAFRDLGEAFYEWYRAGKVKFVYGTEGKPLDGEIGRMIGLIGGVSGPREDAVRDE